MILPKSLVVPFMTFHSEQKSVVSKVDQLVLADFLAQGLFDKHLAKCEQSIVKTTSIIDRHLFTFFK